MEPEVQDPAPAAMVVDRPQKSKMVKMVVGAVVAVLVLGAAWFAYATRPTKVWNSFITRSLKQQQLMHESFSLGYADNMEADPGKQNFMSSFLTKAHARINAEGYVNSTNPEKPEIDLSYEYHVGSGDSDVSAKGKVIATDGSFYLNFGSNPIARGMLQELSPDKVVEWLKIDPVALAKMSQTPSSTPVDFTAQVKAYQELMEKSIPKIITLQKVVGTERLDGHRVVHFKNGIDKTQLKDTAAQIVELMVKQIAAQEPQAEPKDIDEVRVAAKRIIDVIVDRMEVKTFETWVGVTDARLYKIQFVTSAPSLLSLSEKLDTVGEGDPNPDPAAQAEEAIKTTTFGADISYEATMSKYGVKQTVVAPAEFLDLVSSMEDQKKRQEEEYMQYNEAPIEEPTSTPNTK